MKKVDHEMPVNSASTTNECQHRGNLKKSQNDESIENQEKSVNVMVAITIDVCGASLSVGTE